MEAVRSVVGAGRLPLPPRQRAVLGTILAGGAVLRLAWALIYAVPPQGPQLHDPVLYMILAEQLADGEGYAYPGEEGGVTAYYPPGYPIFLSLLLVASRALSIGVGVFDLALWANVVLSTLTIPLVFGLGRRLAGVEVGLLAAAAFAFWPNAIVHSGVVLTETLFLFLFVVLLHALLASKTVTERPGAGRLVAVGVLFGLIGLIRPVSLVIGPLFLLLWWPDGVRSAIRNTAIVGAATLAVILPWTVRNTVVMEAPVLLSTNFGDNLCIGNNPDAHGGYQEPAYCFPEHLRAGERPEFETRRQSHTFSQALDWMVENPGGVAGQVPRRLWHTVLIHDHDGIAAADGYGQDLLSSKPGIDELTVVADVSYYVLLAAAVGGVIVIIRCGAMADRRWQVFVLAAPVGLLAPLLTFGDPRFKMSIYPVVAVCAAVAGAALLTRSSPFDGSRRDLVDDGGVRAGGAADPADAERLATSCETGGS